MRRPIRPFTVEKKRGARPSPLRDPGEPQSAPAPTPLFPAEPQPPQGGANWAAAEALFRSAGDRKPEASGRILQSLVEPAPQIDLEPEPPAPRRGRKPGSRNKPKAPALEAAPLLPQFDEQPMHETPAAAPVVALPAAPIVLRRRGRIERAELPRGERWKGRLPRFAR